VHVAGYIEVGESMRQPERYLHNNVTKSEVLVAAAVRHGVDTFVFSSTCAVYGMPQTEKLDETHRTAQSLRRFKGARRSHAHRAASAGLRSASLRYFNAAGADIGGEIGEAHEPETHLLPLAVDATLGLGPSLTLLGDDYPTPDGSCVRDFIHVSDLADTHLRALYWLQRARHPSAQSNSMSETALWRSATPDRDSTHSQSPVPHTVGPHRPGHSPRLVGNIEKSHRELGWLPKRDLDIQIEDTLRWRRKMPR